MHTVLQPIPPVHNWVAICVLAFAKAPYIGAGAKTSPRPGDDNGTDLRVDLGRLDGLHLLIDHDRGEGIEDLRTVQGDNGNPIVFRVDNLLVAHDFSPT